MKKIAIVSQKGGGGKTHTSILLALASASKNKKTLLVDSDPQGGSTAFLIGDEEPRPGLFDLLTANKFEPVTVKRDELEIDVLPGDYRLDEMAVQPYAYKNKMQHFDGYDVVIFDTPPSMQGFTSAALMIADEVITPSDISKASLGPLKYTIKTVRAMEKETTVYLIGHKDTTNKTGWMADLIRQYEDFLRTENVDLVPIKKSVSIQKAVFDPDKKWTARAMESILSDYQGVI